MIINITPENIEKNTATSSGDPYLTITADDASMYTCWLPELFASFEIGMTTKAEVAQRGSYMHITGVPGIKVKPRAQARPAQQANGGNFQPKRGNFSGNKGNFKADSDDRARGAARGLCFGKAVDLTIAMHSKKELKGKNVFKEVDRVFNGLLNVLEKVEPNLRN